MECLTELLFLREGERKKRRVASEAIDWIFRVEKRVGERLRNKNCSSRKRREFDEGIGHIPTGYTNVPPLSTAIVKIVSRKPAQTLITRACPTSNNTSKRYSV
jgi:hypothetical protein